MVVLRRIRLLRPVALVGSPPVAGVFTYPQPWVGKSYFDWSCVCVRGLSGTDTPQGAAIGALCTPRCLTRAAHLGRCGAAEGQRVGEDTAVLPEPH